MTPTEIRSALSEAQSQATAIAQSHNDGELRTLAIAIAEVAGAVKELVK
jgi:hypothetical protein